MTATPRSIRDTGDSLPAIIKRTDPSVLWSIVAAVVAIGTSYGIMLYKVQAIEAYISDEKAKDEKQAESIRGFYADRLPVITNGMTRNTARLDAIVEDMREVKSLLHELSRKGRKSAR